MEGQLPIACTLSDAAFRERREEVLKTVLGAVVEQLELTDGYAYCFPPETKWIVELAEFIAFERECCPFLKFNLRIEPESGPIWLEVTGPEGTKEFLQSVFAEQITPLES
jgi:hypothetical protein